VGRTVELTIDPLRGEKVSVDLPPELRTPPEKSRTEVGLADWVDVNDPLVARAVTLLAAAKRTDPGLHLAFLGGGAHRLRCLASNRPDLGLRRELHDLDLACLHKELGKVRAFLTSLRDREGSGLHFFETNGDRIFNAMGEGRRLRYHFVANQDDSGVRLATIDLLADEFRFCHRFDLRPDVLSASSQHGTLSPTLLLLTKLQYIQRVPGADRSRVAEERVLEPIGRHDLVIGPEAKDVRDVLALLLDCPIAETADGISPTRISAFAAGDWGLWRTLTLNVAMAQRSPILTALPTGPRTQVQSRLAALASTLASSKPKRRLAVFGGAWFEEVDALPAADLTVRAG
jgi:hypothetical protein